MSAPLTPVQWLVRAEDARLDAAAVKNPQVKRTLRETGYRSTGILPASRSSFAAIMKSFSCRPLIFLVRSETVA